MYEKGTYEMRSGAQYKDKAGAKSVTEYVSTGGFGVQPGSSAEAPQCRGTPEVIPLRHPTHRDTPEVIPFQRSFR